MQYLLTPEEYQELKGAADAAKREALAIVRKAFSEKIGQLRKFNPVVSYPGEPRSISLELVLDVFRQTEECVFGKS